MTNQANIVANDIARAIYLVDASGNPISSMNPAGVNISQIGSVSTQMASSDGVATSNVLEAVPGLYNGAGIDRQRGNIDTYVLLASGTITGNSNSGDQINYNGRGIKLFVNSGAFGSGASTITVTLQGKDPVSGQYYTVLTSASLTASTFTVLSVYPGLTASANVTANDVLPRTFRVTYQASAWGTGGSTLGIACAIIL